MKMIFCCRGVRKWQFFLYPVACNSFRSGLQRFTHDMKWISAVAGRESGKYCEASVCLLVSSLRWMSFCMISISFMGRYYGVYDP